jgi:hypothetical protein
MEYVVWYFYVGDHDYSATHEIIKRFGGEGFNSYIQVKGGGK